jgi:predicted MFS family arabinose efflux permease
MELRAGSGHFGLMARYGWRPVFIGIGLVSLAGFPAWMKWMPRGEAIGHHDGLVFRFLHPPEPHADSGA